MQNMMRRQQMNWVFEIVKLALLGVSGYLTYGFLSRFLADFWFRLLALVLYELGLLAWHYIHHWKVETPRQHMFSRNMERLCLVAVASAAGYQLLTLVSHSFGDVLPLWTHSVVEVVTVVIFLVNVWAFMRWEKLSHYYQAVEHSYNRQLATGQATIINAVLASTGVITEPVKVVDSGEKLALPEAPQGAEREGATDTDLKLPTAVQNVINQAVAKVTPVRVEDRLPVLELLKKEHPDMPVKEIARLTGLSPSSVRRWQQKEGQA